MMSETGWQENMSTIEQYVRDKDKKKSICQCPPAAEHRENSILRRDLMRQMSM